MEELKKYLYEIGKKYQLDDALVYCSNTTVNGVLLYFAREAAQLNIEYKVKIGIPGDISKLVVDSPEGRCYSYYDRHSTTAIATALVVRLT